VTNDVVVGVVVVVGGVVVVVIACCCCCSCCPKESHPQLRAEECDWDSVFVKLVLG
jgi:hypothetical protein